jgi:hypothetical protein
MAQIVIPRSKAKEVLVEMHGGTSRGHLETNKTIDKFRQRYYWLHLRGDVERWCQPVPPAGIPEPGVEV